MDVLDFPIEFQSDVPNLNPAVQAEVERRLLDLKGDHNDMTGAAVAVSKPAQEDVPYVFRVRIVVYTRPNDVVGVKEDDTIEGALKSALSAVERQVREKRKKLGEPWKRPDIEDQI
jgi:ribosome-associated translation inhibitor RaiA